jgi:hypothetical protein
MEKLSDWPRASCNNRGNNCHVDVLYTESILKTVGNPEYRLYPRMESLSNVLDESLFASVFRFQNLLRATPPYSVEIVHISTYLNNIDRRLSHKRYSLVASPSPSIQHTVFMLSLLALITNPHTVSRNRYSICLCAFATVLYRGKNVNRQRMYIRGCLFHNLLYFLCNKIHKSYIFFQFFSIVSTEIFLTQIFL